MTTEAIIMMASILTIVWGGFIAALVLASRREKQTNIHQGENSESES